MSVYRTIGPTLVLTYGIIQIGPTWLSKVGLLVNILQIRIQVKGKLHVTLFMLINVTLATIKGVFSLKPTHLSYSKMLKCKQLAF